MKQALHIFQKDIRYLRYDIATILTLAALYIWAGARTPNPAWAELLLVIAGAYTISRLVQAESIPGDNQFWLTRPYNRRSLVLAKLIGLFVLIVAPMFLARFVVMLSIGFPPAAIVWPLAWSQFVLVLSVLLPVAAIAAVTSNIVQFTFSLLLLVAVAFAIDASILPPSLRSVRLVLTPMQWVWSAIVVIAVASAAIPALYLQYRHRRTWLSRSVLATIGLAAALAYSFVPWPFAAELQTTISANDFDIRPLRVSLNASARKFFAMGMIGRNGVQVDVPLSIEGVSPAIEVVPDAVSLSFHASDGLEWAPGVYRFPAIGKRLPGAGPATLNINLDVPREFFDRARDKPVRVAGRLYLTFFGKPVSAVIPIGPEPAEAVDGLGCAMGPFRQLSCRSAFRWPAKLIYARFEESGAVPFTRTISYSPFPSGLALYPSEQRQVFVPVGAKQATIIANRLLASIKHDFVVENFPLANMGIPATGTARKE